MDISQLQDAIVNDLTQYTFEKQHKINELGRTVAEDALDILRDTSPVYKGNKKRKRAKGKYKKSWRLKETENMNGSITYTCYNTQGNLTHLLENDHATRDGTGIVKGQPHIEPAQEIAGEKFYGKVGQILNDD
jgi:hypothetical protein